MTCDGAIGAVTLELPCLVGLDLRARGEMVPGIHATECRLAGTGTPIAWSLLLPMGQVAAEEKVVLHIPDEAPTVPTDAGPVALGSQRATFSSVLGTLSFSRIDPDGRAFAGTLDAKVFWKATSGAGITCDLEGPLWGAPGDFL